MHVFTKLQEIPVLDGPSVASFGTFDGVHLGHNFIFERVLQEAAKRQAKTALLTFSNQPAELLFPDRQVLKLTSHEQKNALLESCGFDVLVDLPFDEHLRNLSAEEFLTAFRKMVPFSLLVVGSDVTFGKGRVGNQEWLLSKSRDFETIFLNRFAVGGIPVSSSRIRQAILDGKLSLARQLLGRPYVITGNYFQKDGKILVQAPGFVLPQAGLYEVDVRFDAQKVAFRTILSISSGLEIALTNSAGVEYPQQGSIEIIL